MGCADSKVEVGAVNKNPVRIAFVGLPGVGKTSIIDYLCRDYSAEDPPPPTNGILIKNVIIEDIFYRIYDFGGCQGSRGDIPAYDKEIDAYILLCDQFTIINSKKLTKDLIGSIIPLAKTKSSPLLILMTRKCDETSINELREMIISALPSDSFRIELIETPDQMVFHLLEWITHFVIK